jgi:DNA-binding MarR family transcriptional regulator
MSSHYDLVKALGGDKSNISHSLRTLEERGWMVISRTPGGQANSIDLTPEGPGLSTCVDALKIKELTYAWQNPYYSRFSDEL